MNPRLQGYAAAVFGTLGADQTGVVSGDLAAVDRLVNENDKLRSALIDTAVAPQARKAVITDLVGNRIHASAVRIVAFAVSSTKSADIPAALTWLAKRSADDAIDMLGKLASRERIGGFATALFEEMDLPAIEEMEDELFRFARTVETNSALREALGDRDLPSTVRRGVVDDLLTDKVTNPSRRLIDFVMDAGRPRDLVGSLYWLIDQAAAARGWRVAQVTAALDVDDADRTRLSDTLGRLSGQPVELQVTLDAALLAGIRVRIGDLQVDATARGRLDQLKEHMSSGTWHNSGFGGLGSSASGAGGQGSA